MSVKITSRLEGGLALFRSDSYRAHYRIILESLIIRKTVNKFP